MRLRLAFCIIAFLVFGPSALLAWAQAEERHGGVGLISDIHFNPFDPPDLADSLAALPVEDWLSVFATIEQQAMSPWGSDSNFALFASSASAFGKTAADADFAIIVGDFLAHEFEAKAADALGTASTDDKVQALAVKATVFVADIISRALPDKPIIAVLGNNDSECGDYELASDGGYLARTKDTVRRLAGTDLVASDFDETFSAGGYYAVRHPVLPRTRILVINNILWSAKYLDACGTGGERAANDMLRWLRTTLRRQTATGDPVWLVHHIPWGIDGYSTAEAQQQTCEAKIVPFLREPYATEFIALLREFGTTIQASFASHVHKEDYRLLADTDAQPVLAQKIVPAISPIYKQNPGYSVVRYDRETGIPTDFSTYYLANLATASLSVPGDWRYEYTFSKAYGLAQYSASSVATLIKQIRAGSAATALYRKYHWVSHGQIPQERLKAHMCAVTELDVDAFARCYCPS